MSNIVTITRTKFTNIVTGESTLGYRIYDNYAQDYNNCMDSIPDDDLDLLTVVKAVDSEVVNSMLEFVVENEGTIMIDKEFYEFDQIKHILAPE